MKGLTPEEYKALLNAAQPCPGRDGFEALAPDRREASYVLVEQGRAKRGLCVDHRDCVEQWLITPAGREALRLWSLLRERFSREGSK